MSRYGGGSGDLDRPAFPNVVETIGDDPARYLYDRPRWVALARIRGLRTFDEVRAWRAVEKNLAKRKGVIEEPRDWVLDALDDRETELEEHGEFDPDVDREPFETGAYDPTLWEDRGAGALPPITPHEENIAQPVADGGQDGDQA